ncbi:hypothetical protein BDK51DRAFT_32833 [Blyttiomyces helicus]|uniref:Protein kinase domain-containing protein n=1 Tax=Blyttiomyces helicus TaxID=388810 RepID=A0A4P9VTL3_9FUNG|nr:hypothetical protein BDK51DRAFT_32833 [Blyttiomyces helicus]|eukprot:RKO82871.1 hypothetical protein BDK51DRAFT_32833 [Blyttiomyces helicus]
MKELMSKIKSKITLFSTKSKDSITCKPAPTSTSSASSSGNNVVPEPEPTKFHSLPRPIIRSESLTERGSSSTTERRPESDSLRRGVLTAGAGAAVGRPNASSDAPERAGKANRPRSASAGPRGGAGAGVGVGLLRANASIAQAEASGGRRVFASPHASCLRAPDTDAVRAHLAGEEDSDGRWDDQFAAGEQTESRAPPVMRNSRGSSLARSSEGGLGLAATAAAATAAVAAAAAALVEPPPFVADAKLADFALERKLGYGAFSKVYLCRRRVAEGGGDRMAIKIMSKAQVVEWNQDVHIMQER